MSDELRYPAYEKWLLNNFGDDIERAAHSLWMDTKNGPSDSSVWYYLEQTGDKQYTVETFRKAARLMFELAGADHETA